MVVPIATRGQLSVEWLELVARCVEMGVEEKPKFLFRLQLAIACLHWSRTHCSHCGLRLPVLPVLPVCLPLR